MTERLRFHELLTEFVGKSEDDEGALRLACQRIADDEVKRQEARDELINQRKSYKTELAELHEERRQRDTRLADMTRQRNHYESAYAEAQVVFGKAGLDWDAKAEATAADRDRIKAQRDELLRRSMANEEILEMKTPAPEIRILKRRVSELLNVLHRAGWKETPGAEVPWMPPLGKTAQRWIEKTMQLERRCACAVDLIAADGTMSGAAKSQAFDILGYGTLEAGRDYDKKAELLRELYSRCQDYLDGPPHTRHAKELAALTKTLDEVSKVLP